MAEYDAMSIAIDFVKLSGISFGYWSNICYIDVHVLSPRFKFKPLNHLLRTVLMSSLNDELSRL